MDSHHSVAERKGNKEIQAYGQEPGKKEKHGDILQLQHDCKQREDCEKRESGKEPPQCEYKHQIKLESIGELFSRLKLRRETSYKQSRDFLLVTPPLQRHKPCDEKNLVQTYVQGLLMADYTARYIPTEEEKSEPLNIKGTMVSDVQGGNAFENIFKRSVHVHMHKRQPIHPMDIQMAVFLCADHFLRQLMVTKLSQCQYALPLLVPNIFTKEIEFPLWTFRQFKKSWKSHKENISKNQTIYKAETHMVAVFRLSAVSSSKSELMNNLINERHETFFHRHCRGSNKSRLLMDGVVEIAWYCPSGEKTDKFTDCVAFCNLHGDAQVNDTQLQILTDNSSINVVLLPNLDSNDKSMKIVEELYNSTKPLICLLTEDDSGVSKMKEGKYTIGMKERNRSEISEELRRTINECLSKPLPVFKLENMGGHPGIKVDENDDECRRGKEAAEKMMRLLKTKEMSEIKETFLPCQGKLWHDWCQKNKELHRPQGNNIEMHNSQKQTEMRKIREQQKRIGLSEFLKLFIEKLNIKNAAEKMYFLKWLGILLDEYTSKDLCKLHHEYYETWSKVLDLKKQHDKSAQLAAEQSQLEKLSEKLNLASFGLEHILREIAQIYESHISVKNKGSGCNVDVRSLPQFAAELMISGYPLELMDGDASHVPLIWVQAVLDELIKMLGDQKVFVLSILGIQSTGKSTMLNAMFGLQFAVSAGRCTRGAFMQLVKVSEELKTHLNFDYFLIVDTEGLHALELAGRSTRHHDNEMATFVVGLGNMTLINIFGENPAEMQDILQIVVQAFLRMKKVRLNPSCMFVHQNVGDITAGEKNMVGKRRLQEKLDEMTQLAAKEEVCGAECFSDVIGFDIKTDVRYFAQLWEGSPPMAPPNPGYSENVQELKNTILSRASKYRGLTLKQFKDRVGDLWNALLNENFVFSFKNTLEIATYRKLEEEYAKWTWSLRSAMLKIEDKLHNRINNKQLHKVESRDLEKEMEETNEEVKESMKLYFEEQKEKEMLNQWKSKFQEKIKHLHWELVRDAKRKLENIINQKKALTKLDGDKTLHERKLLEKSKELAFSLKQKGLDENELKAQFDVVWEKWVSQLAGNVEPFEELDIKRDIITIISEIQENALVLDRLDKYECKKISDLHKITDFTTYVNLIGKYWKNRHGLPPEEQGSIKQLVYSIGCETVNQVNSKSVASTGYNPSYIQEIAQLVKINVGNHKCKEVQYEFKKEFIVDLTIRACKWAGEKFSELHQVFRNNNDPLIYLERKKPEYYSVFQGFCKGAKSAAIFGALICSELKKPILQSAYNKAANDLAGEMRANIPSFKGNRSNLEKHILKALVEKEDFQKFIQYIHLPRNHFEDFIKAEVKAYITGENSPALAMINGNIKNKGQSVITAAEKATSEVLSKRGDANTWLEIFSDCLKDELEYSKEHLTGNCCEDITDFELLKEVVKKELQPITEESNKYITKPSDIDMKMFREPPDEILIKHFCQCCWVQCPFCRVVCVNTMEDHLGDHIAPFHRNCGMRGMIYKGTNNLCLMFCTSSVASKTEYFYPDIQKDDTVLWMEYRTAGPDFEKWSITPDVSELPYWKWFVCRFQKDLEEHYNKTFSGYGKIPNEWRSFTKKQALESLEKYL